MLTYRISGMMRSGTLYRSVCGATLALVQHVVSMAPGVSTGPLLPDGKVHRGRSVIKPPLGNTGTLPG